jgi:probable rRNA maturation factor
VEINVYFDEGFENTLDAAWLKNIAGTTLGAESQPDAEMGIVITGQTKIHELNSKYRAKDRPTDVLAFALKENPEDITFPTPDDDLDHLGEVVISLEQASKQAKSHRHSVEREVAVLLVHGILHLLGYDHAEAEEEQVMKQRAKEILKLIPRRVA